ncbi:LrgB family protein, partial [Klebsiella pneumoniae]|uniref:LrgB family protein n=1 Tax=Klebsiella pneumoniae TaxID=573 RepID=UPI00210CFDA0
MPTISGLRRRGYTAESIREFCKLVGQHPRFADVVAQQQRDAERTRCAELDYQEGAFSSLALVLCGIITSLMAPFLFPLILAFALLWALNAFFQ